MSEQTSLLQLPYIMLSQAQKHVTHNEALRIIDAILHVSIAGMGTDIPPEAPEEGERHVIGDAPTGAFAGHNGEIAVFQDGGWAFHLPREGWILWDGQVLRVLHAGNWIAAAPARMPRLGIETDADETNRLAVASAATLLTHAGAGHQVKVNKAAQDDTASLLFQSDWSGRAEMGLAGNDDFAIKVSADGAAWQTALHIDRATGRIGIGVGTPQTTLDVEGVVRSATGFRIGEAVLQNGLNAYQLSTSAHFSTSGLLAVGTTPLSSNYLRIRVPDATAARRAIYAYSHMAGVEDGNPLFVVLGDGRTGIGTMLPAASAVLDLVSTSQGFLPPRMTEVQRDTISAPAEGLMIYNVTAHKPQFWNGTAWMDMGAAL